VYLSVTILYLRIEWNKTGNIETSNMRNEGATTVKEYLDVLPDDRKDPMNAIRDIILTNLPQGYEECFGFGMITYIIPLKRFPDTYNKQPLMVAALANQKNYMSLYLMTVYGDKNTEDWFKDEFKKSGKKLDMGKSCVHFKKLDDLPLDLISQVISRVSVENYIKKYESIVRK
jgi:hypothetical protein